MIVVFPCGEQSSTLAYITATPIGAFAMANITGSSSPDFSEGLIETFPDAKRTALGYAGIIAGYIFAKGKKKK
jgi:hypothetical protein